MSFEWRYDNKVVVVMDAASRAGCSLALKLACLGAKVVVNHHEKGVDCIDRNGAADQVVVDILALGGQAVANDDPIEQASSIIQTAIDNFDRVDIVITRGGVLRDVCFIDMTAEEWGKLGVDPESDRHLDDYFVPIFGRRGIQLKT